MSAGLSLIYLLLKAIFLFNRIDHTVGGKGNYAVHNRTPNPNAMYHSVTINEFGYS